MTWKPISSIAAITEAGGGAAAVITSTVRPSGRRAASGALTSMLRTIGAPQKWLTPWSAMASKMAPGSTLRRHTWVPPIAAMVQGKHQPLQWNIGSVQR